MPRQDSRPRPTPFLKTEGSKVRTVTLESSGPIHDITSLQHFNTDNETTNYV